MEAPPKKVPELSKNQFLKILDDEGATYTESTVDMTGLDGPLDTEGLSELPPHLIRFVQSTAESVREYLTYPIIKDNFTDHAQRRMWRNKVGTEHGKTFHNHYERNKLKGNCIFPIYSWFHGLQDALSRREPESPKLREMKELLSQLPDLKNYDTVGVEGKILIVEQVVDICTDFLRLVTKHE